jgi:hypothetical protein
VVVLEDNDVVHLRTGAYGIFNATFTERHTAVPRLLETLNMEVSQIMKGGYDTFMQARSHRASRERTAPSLYWRDCAVSMDLCHGGHGGTPELGYCTTARSS